MADTTETLEDMIRKTSNRASEIIQEMGSIAGSITESTERLQAKLEAITHATEDIGDKLDGIIELRENTVGYSVVDEYEERRRAKKMLRKYQPKPVTDEQLKEAYNILRFPTENVLEPLQRFMTGDKDAKKILQDIGFNMFKYNGKAKTNRMYNMLYNQAVIMQQNLTQLVIPRFALLQMIPTGDSFILKHVPFEDILDLTDDKYTFIVEHISCEENQKVQRKLFSDAKEDTIMQLVMFICETGYPTVNFETATVCSDGKIVVAASDKPKNPTAGLAGTMPGHNDEAGLISFAPLRLLDKIVKLACTYPQVKPWPPQDHYWSFRDITVFEATEIRYSRSQNSELDTFYLNNQIFTGFELITIEGVSFPEFKGKPIDPALSIKEYKRTDDEIRKQESKWHTPEETEESIKLYARMKKLALKSDQKAKEIYPDMEHVLLKLAEVMIREINESIQEHVEDMSMMDRRKVSINVEQKVPFVREYFDYKSVVMPEAIGGSEKRDPPSYGEYVAGRLREHGKIYSVRYLSGRGYIIQA